MDGSDADLHRRERHRRERVVALKVACYGLGVGEFPATTPSRQSLRRIYAKGQEDRLQFSASYHLIG